MLFAQSQVDIMGMVKVVEILKKMAICKVYILKYAVDLRTHILIVIYVEFGLICIYSSTVESHLTY